MAYILLTGSLWSHNMLFKLGDKRKISTCYLTIIVFTIKDFVSCLLLQSFHAIWLIGYLCVYEGEKQIK